MSRCRRAGAALLALLLLFPFGPAAAAPPGEGAWETTVLSVSFRGDAPVDEAWLARLVDVVPGRKLTAGAVRTSLRNLFATRLFADLAIEAAPGPEGTRVVFVFAAAARVEALRLEGKGIPEKGKLRDALGMERGDPWSLEQGEDARRRAQRFLHDRGFFDALVSVVADPAADGTGVLVTFRVEPGLAVLAAPPEFSGSPPPFPAAKLLAVARQKLGKPFREAAARDDAERFTRVLREEGFARAEVRFEGDRRAAGAREATPLYSLFAGPRTTLRVAGLKEAKVREDAESPWHRGETVDEESLRRLQASLVRKLQEEGYARATVAYELSREGDAETVLFRVERGERRAVRGVSIPGAREVPEKVLRPLLRTRPRGLLAVGRLVEGDLVVDRETLASTLRGRGYADAKAAPPAVTEGPSRFTFDVAFPVEEGPRFVVSSVALEGASRIPLSTLTAGLSLGKGRPFTAEALEGDAGLIRSIYSDRGFLDARVEASSSTPAGEGSGSRGVEVKYSIFEGSQVYFGKTIVRGNVRTRTGVLESAFLHTEGEPFSLSRLMETRARLDRFGIFSRIDLTAFPTDPDTRSRSVLLTVTEGKPWNLLYGAGLEYDSTLDSRRLNPRLSLAVSYMNLFGRAMAATVEGRYSRRDSRVLLRLVDPAAFNWDVPANLTFYLANQLGPDYEVNRTGAFAQLEKKLTRALKVSARYQYEIIEPTGDQQVIGQLDRTSQQARISSVAAGAIVDTRDDAIDPRTGLFVVSELKYAFPLLAADASFLKAFIQASTYAPWGRKGRFALSARLGLTSNFAPCDPTSNPSCLPNLAVPIVERFFAGGRSSHRAFPLDGLGIDGQTISLDGSPTGGNALFIVNAESRLVVSGDLGLTLFFDAGNVWAAPTNMRVADIRYGVGLGVHYMTPVGPARLEYGVKLGRRAGEDPGALSFSIGFPF